MQHDSASGRLSAYDDGELSLQEREQIERHLAECAVCARRVQEYRSLSRMMSQIALPTLDAAFLQKIHTRVRQACDRPVERFVGLLSGIAACLAIAGGLLLMQPANSSAVLPPASWEGQAVGILDDNTVTPASATREAALGQWMVSNLPSGDEEVRP